MTPQVASLEHLSAAADAVRAAQSVFLDTEFHSENRYSPELFLVQIAVPEVGEWIVDPLRDGALDVLRDALLATPWVVHGGHQDMRILNRVLGGLPERIWDTQIAAGLVGERFPATFASLVAAHLDVTLEKGATLTDWSRRPLTRGQLQYALDDVKWLMPLWRSVHDQVVNAGRLPLLASACDDARLRAITPPDPDEAWRHFGAAWTLNPAGATALKHLAAWRERTARTMRQPARRVVGDGLLMELARRRPTTLDALREDRRMPRGVAKRHGEALLSCLRQSEHAPGTPVVSKYTAQGRLARWLDLAARTQGARDHWAADLVLPQALIERLVLSGSSRAHGALESWRAALAGPLVEEAFSGASALRPSNHDVSADRTR